jgi:peptide/nickel transport system permease protein
VLVYGVAVLVTNTAVDVALALLDPRSMIRED